MKILPTLPYTALYCVSVKSQSFWDALSTGNVDQSARGSIADEYAAKALWQHRVSQFMETTFFFTTRNRIFIYSIDPLKPIGYYTYHQL